MAASMIRVNFRNLSSFRQCYAIYRSYPFNTRLLQTTSNSSFRNEKPIDTDHGITVTSNGAAIVCWHPEPPFPYECTQPMPMNEEELAQASSPLKVNLQKMDKYRYTQDGPTDRQLKALFFTTKNQWFPRPRSRRRKDNPPSDRDSI